jgi:hypothetical protein
VNVTGVHGDFQRGSWLPLDGAGAEVEAPEWVFLIFRRWLLPAPSIREIPQGYPERVVAMIMGHRDVIGTV